MKCPECSVNMRWDGTRTHDGVTYDVYVCINGHEREVER